MPRSGKRKVAFCLARDPETGLRCRRPPAEGSYFCQAHLVSPTPKRPSSEVAPLPPAPDSPEPLDHLEGVLRRLAAEAAWLDAVVAEEEAVSIDKQGRRALSPAAEARREVHHRWMQAARAAVDLDLPGRRRRLAAAQAELVAGALAAALRAAEIAGERRERAMAAAASWIAEQVGRPVTVTLPAEETPQLESPSS
jgi:hypothetical protein